MLQSISNVTSSAGLNRRALHDSVRLLLSPTLPTSRITWLHMTFRSTVNACLHFDECRRLKRFPPPWSLMMMIKGFGHFDTQISLTFTHSRLLVHFVWNWIHYNNWLNIWLINQSMTIGNPRNIEDPKVLSGVQSYVVLGVRWHLKNELLEMPDLMTFAVKFLRFINFFYCNYSHCANIEFYANYFVTSLC